MSGGSLGERSARPRRGCRCWGRHALHLRDDLGKLLGRQHGGVGEHDGAEDGVLELADIARPVVAHEQLQRRRGDAADEDLAFLGGEPRGEMADQLGDILAPLAERRHPDREDIEAVVEVLAEGAGLDQVDEAAVGRRDQPEVDADRPPCADRVDLAVLERAEQLDLHLGRQLADLVEEERAAVGLAEFPGMLVGGAGEGALLVAEEDALDEVVGDGAAVDRDEGLRARGRRRPGWRGRSAPCRRPTRPR